MSLDASLHRYLDAIYRITYGIQYQTIWEQGSIKILDAVSNAGVAGVVQDGIC